MKERLDLRRYCMKTREWGHSSLEDFSNLGAQKCLFLSFRRTFAVNKYEGKCNSRLIYISSVISKA